MLLPNSRCPPRQVEKQIKGNLAVKAVGAAQGLVVPQNEVDDEVMTLQAQALQRGEKFKESEVRPQVEMQAHATGFQMTPPQAGWFQRNPPAQRDRAKRE